jgi:hypothetical protein
MLALAHALRSRPMKFGFWFLLISLMPVCIIPIFRNGFMLYIPMIGWALYWGALWTREWSLSPPRLPKYAGSCDSCDGDGWDRGADRYGTLGETIAIRRKRCGSSRTCRGG